MADPIVIPVGKSTTARFVAGGDECMRKNILSYAVVYVPRTRVSTILRKIASIKKRFRLPQSTPLHCRVLFNPDNRRRAGLEHLSTEHARSVVASAITAIVEARSFVRCAITTVEDARAALGDTMVFRSSVDDATYSMPVGNDPKGLFGLLMSICTLDDPVDHNVPKSIESEIFVASERSKVQFLGRAKRADSMLSHYSEIGTPEGVLHQLTPNIAEADEHPLLELADIVAYVCTQAHDSDLKFPYFPQQLARMRHRMTFVRMFEGGSKYPPGYPHAPQAGAPSQR